MSQPPGPAMGMPPPTWCMHPTRLVNILIHPRSWAMPCFWHNANIGGTIKQRLGASRTSNSMRATADRYDEIPSVLRSDTGTMILTFPSRSLITRLPCSRISGCIDERRRDSKGKVRSSAILTESVHSLFGFAHRNNKDSSLFCSLEEIELSMVETQILSELSGSNFFFESSFENWITLLLCLVWPGLARIQPTTVCGSRSLSSPGDTRLQ